MCPLLCIGYVIYNQYQGCVSYDQLVNTILIILLRASLRMAVLQNQITGMHCYNLPQLLPLFCFILLLIMNSVHIRCFRSRSLISRRPIGQQAFNRFQSSIAAYNHISIESKWQKHWDDNQTFLTRRRPNHPKKYVLDMFPYPSGAGLHVGHPEGYTATDIMARYWRMKDFDVLHPMGWDAFGLPAEQHAINTGTHPADTTYTNIATFKRQLKSLGFSYDW